jgi:deoxyribonuclease V
MKIRRIHDWDVAYRDAVRIQQELKDRLILSDGYIPSRIRTVAGVDLSYSKKDDLFFAAAILFDYSTMEVLETSHIVAKVAFPYIPGLLSFREGPAILSCFQKLERVPDVIIFDGQGIAHPRGFGLASHMGLLLDRPSIGCAKTRLIGVHGNVGQERGDYAHLIVDDQIVGAVLRTKKKVKPVFVSPGHRTGVKGAVEIVLACTRGYRLPEPTRIAHLLVNRLRREHSPAE